MKNNDKKQLIILNGKEDSINYFLDDVLKQTSYEESKYAKLHLTNEELDKNNYLNSSIQSLKFIIDDSSTKNIENIFFFVHTDNLNIMENVVGEICDKIESDLRNIKYIYLVNGEEQVSPTKMNGVNKIVNNFDLDVGIDDLFDDLEGMDDLELLRKKVYLLGDIIDMSLMAFGEGIPSEIKNDVADSLRGYIKQLNSI